MKQLVVAIFLFSVFAGTYGQTKTTYLFIGTYTDNKPGKGIYVYAMNAATGELTLTSTCENITNPSFLTVSPNGNYLYACTDTKTLQPGSVSAFAIDSVTGAINFINKQSSTGANPVYVAVDKSNQFVAVANYTAGSAAILSINKNGELNPAMQSIQFYDSSINKTRQDKSHIHSTIFSPDYHYLYLPDLGADKIRAFKFDPAASLPLIAMDSTISIPGSGPRHMVFHPNKKFAYCIEEMSGMVAVYDYKNGKLKSIQKILSCQQQADEHSSADIHISPDGLFLYASNRGENTLSIFSIEKNGMLKSIGHEPTLGDVPRNFTIDPTCNFLLIANQGTNNIVVFRRNKKNRFIEEYRISNLCSCTFQPADEDLHKINLLSIKNKFGGSKILSTFTVYYLSSTLNH